MVFETIALTAGLFLLIVVLAVLILAVEKLKPKPKLQRTGSNGIRIYYNKPLVREMQKPERLADLKMTERVLQLQSAFAAVRSRVEMAHSRLDSIENELVRTKKAVSEQSRMFATSKDFEVEQKELSELKEFIENKTRKPELEPSFEKNIEKQRRLDDEYIKSIAFGRLRD